MSENAETVQHIEFDEREQSQISVWRTHSNMRTTFVYAPTVAAALVQLARTLADFGLEDYVIDLQFLVDDEDGFIVGAVTEEPCTEEPCS